MVFEKRVKYVIVMMKDNMGVRDNVSTALMVYKL